MVQRIELRDVEHRTNVSHVSKFSRADPGMCADRDPLPSRWQLEARSECRILYQVSGLF
jgi:hypothetical protein